MRAESVLISLVSGLPFFFSRRLMATDGTLDSLIPMLRLKLGDTNSASYRYLDEWLRSALAAAISTLNRRWAGKYYLDATDTVVRSATNFTFEFEAPPVIQYKDEWVIILAASIIVKSGQLENLSWDIGSWRDAELSYSNLESGKQKDQSLQRDIDELNSLLKPAIRRGFNTQRTPFPE